jgi:hypothetical protein
LFWNILFESFAFESSDHLIDNFVFGGRARLNNATALRGPKRDLLVGKVRGSVDA